jgi:hypothetical protein
VLALAGFFLLLRERDSYRSLRCERCRRRAQVALRRTRPALDQRTEINIL